MLVIERKRKMVVKRGIIVRRTLFKIISTHEGGMGVIKETIMIIIKRDLHV
jgi:hypothetical protein